MVIFSWGQVFFLLLSLLLLFFIIAVRLSVLSWAVYCLRCWQCLDSIMMRVVAYNVWLRAYNVRLWVAVHMWLGHNVMRVHCIVWLDHLLDVSVWPWSWEPERSWLSWWEARRRLSDLLYSCFDSRGIVLRH